MQAKHLIIAVLVSFYTATVFSQETLQNRKSYAAGRFYTDQPAELNTQLQQFFSKSIQRKTGKTPIAIIVPHAGYVYSGEVAASAYNQIDPNRKFERIFIIGSSHTTTFAGASVYCTGHYETPLGIVKVDLDLVKQLVKENKLIRCYSEAHLNEHSIEVQLPFLQYYLKTDFKIVPIIIGSSTAETAKKLASILKPYLNEQNLFVISSDFSHYPKYNDARMADQATAEAIKTNKATKLIAALESNENRNIPELVTSLCGWSSVLTLLYMTEQLPDITVDLVQYKNSGDSSYGDKQKVVGYYAISFTQSQAKNQTGRFDAILPLWKVVQSMAVAAATQDYRFSKVQPGELSELKIEISVLTPLKRIQSADEFIMGKQGIYIKKGNSSGTFLPQVANQTNWSKEEFLGHCAEDKAGIGWNGWKTAELYTYEALVFGEGEK
ncbi:MAG: AmmeMemoRadiSam system protein B [Bacteroidia bacterium]|nr:AmmeMemoRadiSam system protein B [Bacteroidia bacterium]